MFSEKGNIERTNKKKRKKKKKTRKLKLVCFLAQCTDDDNLYATINMHA